MNNNRPRRGPGSGPAPKEKANNFSTAINRLFSELKRFHLLIIISLILAAISSVLSIVAPDKLSSLTDAISEGLVINTKNMEAISTKITSSIDPNELKTILPNILSLNITKDTTNKINNSHDITEEEKEQYKNFIDSLSAPDNIIINLNKLSDNILTIILPTTNYEEQTITTQDKIKLVKSLEAFLTKEKKEEITIEIPMSLANILFEEFTLEDKTITTKEQVEFINILGNLNKDTTTSELYSNIDKPIQIIRDRYTTDLEGPFINTIM